MRTTYFAGLLGVAALGAVLALTPTADAQWGYPGGGYYNQGGFYNGYNQPGSYGFSSGYFGGYSGREGYLQGGYWSGYNQGYPGGYNGCYPGGYNNQRFYGGSFGNYGLFGHHHHHHH